MRPKGNPSAGSEVSATRATPCAAGSSAGGCTNGGGTAGDCCAIVALVNKPTHASGTLNAAELLGVSDRGDLAVGKFADIVAVPGNPLENIRTTENVVFVMKGGRVGKWGWS